MNDVECLNMKPSMFKKLRFLGNPYIYKFHFVTGDDGDLYRVLCYNDDFYKNMPYCKTKKCFFCNSGNISISRYVSKIFDYSDRKIKLFEYPNSLTIKLNKLELKMDEIKYIDAMVKCIQIKKSVIDYDIVSFSKLDYPKITKEEENMIKNNILDVDDIYYKLNVDSFITLDFNIQYEYNYFYSLKSPNKINYFRLTNLDGVGNMALMTKNRKKIVNIPYNTFLTNIIR